MCIRDSVEMLDERGDAARILERGLLVRAFVLQVDLHALVAVSYTHLTLPTSDLV